jgi:hypothetical protein
MKQNGVLIVCLLLLAGCYTQFERRDRALADQYIPPDSLMSQDSVRANIPDTLRVNNNQYCYWTRDIFGRPELRCDDSYYGRDWYRYNNNPWWSNSSSYYYGGYNSYGWDEPCPAYYYWDNTCGACRYYSSYSGHQNSWWWNSGSGSYGSSSSSSKSSAPLRSRYTRTEGIPSASERSSGASAQLPKNQAVSPATGSGTGSSNNNVTESRNQRARTTRTEGIPTASERSNVQKANAAAAAERELNKQIEADRPPQQDNVQPQSAPPQPPSQDNARQQSAPSQNTAPQQQNRSSQDNSSGNNTRERGNSRGF